MFRNLLIAMDLSPASICLLGCMGPLRRAGAESATLLHVMNVRNVGGLSIWMKNLVEPVLKQKEKQLTKDILLGSVIHRLLQLAEKEELIASRTITTRL